MIPASSFTFGSDTDFGAFLGVQEVESQAAQDGQVLLCMALTDATVVLTNGDIQDPVDCVFALQWLRAASLVRSPSYSSMTRNCPIMPRSS